MISALHDGHSGGDAYNHDDFCLHGHIEGGDIKILVIINIKKIHIEGGEQIISYRYFVILWRKS